MADRLIHLFLNLYFTAILAPLLLFPRLAQTRLVRGFIKTFFGTILAPRYSKVIALYGARYGLAMSEGISLIPSLTRRRIDTIVDCGTGTGFVTLKLASQFPGASLVSVDAVIPMLLQARQNFAAQNCPARLVCGDIAKLPLLDECADLVVAQNTLPYLQEFARICAPGGVVLFVDSSAKLLTGIAARAAEKTGQFDSVRAGTSELGFFVIGRRGDSGLAKVKS
jgi:SAM-dependent methyltransferase